MITVADRGLEDLESSGAEDRSAEMFRGLARLSAARLSSAGLSSAGLGYCEQWGSDLIYTAAAEALAGCPAGEDVCLPAPVGSAYIDCQELAIALDLYYIGRLDWVEPENVCKDLRELVPGRPLISQLCQDDMATALSQISNTQCHILREWHSQKGYSQKGVVRARVSGQEYLDAIAALADSVMQLL